jgi:hypothetical protein
VVDALLVAVPDDLELHPLLAFCLLRMLETIRKNNALCYDFQWKHADVSDVYVSKYGHRAFGFGFDIHQNVGEQASRRAAVRSRSAERQGQFGRKQTGAGATRSVGSVKVAVAGLGKHFNRDRHRVLNRPALFCKSP